MLSGRPLVLEKILRIVNMMRVILKAAMLPLLGFLALVLLFVNMVPVSEPARYAEADTIGDGITDFQDLSKRFEDLATQKGGKYAFEVLQRASLPPNTDVHLLGHVVGEVLFSQKGIDGISDCTPAFRNACSHTIVIGAFTEFGGEAALGKIQESCKKAPGGPGAYTMCYHGLGHGVFAYYGYDIPHTVALCEKTGTTPYHNREYVECIGGMIMELMGGGGHDHGAWIASRKKYLTSDPLAPCSTSLIPERVKDICYTYITPNLFEHAGADPIGPSPDQLKRSFSYCDKIAATSPTAREACFGGIGKELPVLAVQRDTRVLTAASDEELDQMHEWCRLAPHEEGFVACRNSILDSLFWGGENDPHAAVRFCGVAPAFEQKQCFEYLSGIAETYFEGIEQRNYLCELYPTAEVENCRERLKL